MNLARPWHDKIMDQRIWERPMDSVSETISMLGALLMYGACLGVVAYFLLM